MSGRCIFVFVLVSSLLGILTAQLTYDCRRLNDCANNGTCDHLEESSTFKRCVCSGGYEGETCSFRTDDICTSTNPCQNNGTCYQTNKCSCPYGYYGDKCETEIVDVTCSGSLNVTMVFPDVYEGMVYLEGQQKNCTFLDVTEGGMKIFSISLPMNDTGCGANVTITTNDTEGYTEYQVKVVVQYSKMYLSAVDELHTLNCRMSGNASTLYSDLIGQAIDIAGNLTKSVTDQKYTPVEMVVEDDAKSTLKTGTKLYVGQPFVLYFKLTDNSVYNSMRIERCEANNTLSGTENKLYTILDSGCGTPKGAKVIRALQTPRNDTNGLLGAELKLRAFKFIDSENVGFVCSVKLCKAGDEGSCSVRNQTDCASITSGRRKRATVDSPSVSGQDKTMTTVISVYDPRDYGSLQNQGTEPSAEQCLAKSDILAAFIVLVVAVAILFIACFIFVCICLRRRSHMKEYEPSIMSTGSSEFRIPRAHVNSGFTTM
ncbi:hypothetical protein CHS0354_005272 [Potamilus streckersoni]|uniref:Uncharacterized protein n=1 Tax=Potamilus streckersoni TaxID=2493646 RepID=A0AAE0S3F3_9BIVA|nr:hypothetical protein CHS0354_005272 [Potamilus streckersoni]